VAQTDTLIPTTATCDSHPAAPTDPGTSNRSVGWWSFVFGVFSGLLMGLWSFGGPVPEPGWVGGYDDLARRFLRLGHIAFFGLGFLNLHLARALPEIALGPAWRRTASRAMNFGNITLPAGLIWAAAWEPAKYVLPLPALSVFAALIVVAVGLTRRPAWSIR
jgi:hypothetical protein|tara:strand:+ start:2210 stop:2695 length:486 start_codon:yes stop_codon:yes gene_type:complete